MNLAGHIIQKVAETTCPTTAILTSDSPSDRQSPHQQFVDTIVTITSHNFQKEKR